MTGESARVVACGACGMPCDPAEFHPYAACLMFKGCHNSATVRANLAPLKANATLISGLEALAGEWRRQEAAHIGDGGSCALDGDTCADELLRTLASAGLEGKKERGQFSKCDNCGSGPWNIGWDPESIERKSQKFYCPNCLGAT